MWSGPPRKTRAEAQEGLAPWNSIEAAFLLKREGRGTDPLWAPVERGVVRVDFQIGNQRADLCTLLRRYRDRPMSLADACLVGLAAAD